MQDIYDVAEYNADEWLAIRKLPKDMYKAHLTVTRIQNFRSVSNVDRSIQSWYRYNGASSDIDTSIHDFLAALDVRSRITEIPDGVLLKVKRPIDFSMGNLGKTSNNSFVLSDFGRKLLYN